MASLRSRNLNLIPILQALLQEGSVARAAEQVFLSQPAMSGALARLREALDDPLLVRAGRSMHLTPRAQRLRPQVDQICREIERLFRPESFDPATADNAFVVAAPDYLVFLMSSALLTRLREEAPGIRIRFVDVPTDLPNWIEEGSIALAVCADFGFWPDLEFEHLFCDRIVAAVSAHHPLLKRKRVRSDDLLEFPNLNHNVALLDKRDTKLPTGIPSLDWVSQISTAQFTDAVLLTVDSPIVARAPASVVARLSRNLPLTAIELSGEETGFDTGMFWSSIQQDAQEHLWLREVMRESLASILHLT